MYAGYAYAALQNSPLSLKFFRFIYKLPIFILIRLFALRIVRVAVSVCHSHCIMFIVIRLLVVLTF